ncbi:hypothetical protein B0H17DRAFT_1149763 [Mycena rosella]|uniref:Uncharacterized protein n=1 Tax=Mycena rosella TaxID=1033263 RepID=A0AAD7BY66_MYCRO|nr:hypothetical protein B0H17DRAFT_1149763 [Mycena rosella]
MASCPSVGFLKKDLSKLVASVKKCKDDLTACLKKAKKISNADTAWLDDAGNHVDEETGIEKLENASDYEWDFAHLDAREVRLVKKTEGACWRDTWRKKRVLLHAKWGSGWQHLAEKHFWHTRKA